MSEAKIGGGKVRPLHRIRVLLVGRDPHFIRVVGFLLERHGFLVASTRRPGDALSQVERHRANVVVIDTSNSVAPAARLVAAIEALYPSVGVLAVGEDPSDRMSSFQVLPKWNFALLVEEVERMYMGAKAEKEGHFS